MRGCGYARMVAGPIGLLIALVVQDGEVGADKVTWKLESVHHPFPNQRWILPEVDFWKRQSDGTQLRVLCSFAYTSDAQTYSSVNGKTLSVVRPESNRFWIRFEFDILSEDVDIAPFTTIRFARRPGDDFAANFIRVSFEYKQIEHMMFAKYDVRADCTHEIAVKMEAITKTISRSFAPKKEDISDEEQMAEPVHALSSDIAQTPPSQTRRRRQRWNANPGLCLETIRLSGAIVSGFEDEREHLLDNITRQAGEIERLKGNLATAKQQRDRLRWISVMDVVKAARLNRDLEAVKAGQAQEVTVRNEAVTELGRQRDELLSRFTLQALEIEFLNEKAALLGDQLNYQLDPTSKRHANEFIQRDGNRETHRGVTELERERAHLLAKVTRLSRELEEVKSQATRGSQEISRLKLKVAVLINERDNVQTQGSYQAQEISNLIGLTALLEQQRCSQQVEVNQQALQIMELENERRGLLTNITRQETNISSLKQQVASLRHGRTSLTQQVAALRHGRTSQHKQTRNLASGLLLASSAAVWKLAARAPTPAKERFEMAKKKLVAPASLVMGAGIVAVAAGVALKLARHPEPPAPTPVSPAAPANPLPRVYIAAEYHWPVIAFATVTVIFTTVAAVVLICDCCPRRRHPEGHWHGLL
ncbi:SUN domain-containing protein [Plasmodiophora brassicae]|uniref:SUN domain-containing protein n=1 Tax=Plasmodiophora brassicae TaxID=37360 RepID=A0A0G4IRC7_PLABS|nr:hypothetical protein PBRA_005861 [Plasmodiophora brassicae]SPQ98294.1 unnamed protein product [Plasmodiophora brassicae]